MPCVLVELTLATARVTFKLLTVTKTLVGSKGVKLENVMVPLDIGTM